MTTEIRTLMVPLDGDHPSDAQLQKVGALAAYLGARVIGVSASEHTPSFYFAAGAIAGDVLEQDEQRMKERMAAAANRCRLVLTDLHVPVSCRSTIDIPIDVFAREARAADLIVLSRAVAAPNPQAELLRIENDGLWSTRAPILICQE